MPPSTPLDTFYKLGADLAYEEFEKEAFIGALAAGARGLFAGAKGLMASRPMGVAKWLMGMNPAKNPSAFSNFHTNFIGMPLGGGLLGAATAEEGDRWNQFGKGVLGGLAFTPAAALGSRFMKGVIGNSRLFGKGVSQARKAFNTQVMPKQKAFLENQQKGLQKALDDDLKLPSPTGKDSVIKKFKEEADDNMNRLLAGHSWADKVPRIQLQNKLVNWGGTAGTIAGGIGGTMAVGSVYDVMNPSPPPFNPANLYR